MKRKCGITFASELWKYIILYADSKSAIESDDASEQPMDKQERNSWENQFNTAKMLLISTFEQATGYKPIESINVVNNEPVWRIEWKPDKEEPERK